MNGKIHALLTVFSAGLDSGEKNDFLSMSEVKPQRQGPFHSHYNN
jgi:hypothetical protein